MGIQWNFIQKIVKTYIWPIFTQFWPIWEPKNRASEAHILCTSKINLCGMWSKPDVNPVWGPKITPKFLPRALSLMYTKNWSKIDHFYGVPQGTKPHNYGHPWLIMDIHYWFMGIHKFIMDIQNPIMDIHNWIMDIHNQLGISIARTIFLYP